MYSPYLCHAYETTFKLQQSTFVLHRMSKVYNCSRCLIGQNRLQFSLVLTVCDGMRYNSAKNMTYIPNQGVDMHGDADPGAFNSSDCNTMDIIMTRDCEFFRGSSCRPRLSLHHSLPPKKTRQANIFHGVSGTSERST